MTPPNGPYQPDIIHAHREKMAAKKARVLTPGFTPVRNARIASRFDALTLLVGMQNPGLTPMEIASRADRMLRSELPSAPMVRRTRFKPVKNDDPVYRKQVAAPKPKRRSRAKKAVAA